MESNGKDLTHIYKLRHDFTIIGLTGQIGSGCSDIAGQLSQGFNGGKGFTNPLDIFRASGSKFNHNAHRKHRIIYEYARENFKPYTSIEYRDVLTLFLLTHSLSELSSFLQSPDLMAEFSKVVTPSKKIFPSYDFSSEINHLASLNNDFTHFARSFQKINIEKIKENGNWLDLYDFYFDSGSGFKAFSDKLHNYLSRSAEPTVASGKHLALSYHKAFQVISNNLRKTGHPYESVNSDPNKVFTIVEWINKIIKSHRTKFEDSKTKIVINSLKNPLEIMFFKQRYSAFYAVAVNRDKYDLDLGRFSISKAEGFLDEVMREEHEGGEDSEFFKQKISHCLQLADIHISFLSEFQLKQDNLNIQKDKEEGKINNTTPSFGWKDQLLKYIALIDHPGIITPSPEERCMQLAFTAKHNSGCISRHVGAAITDESYSVKAIGWNNTPEGQVPCVLRNADDLINTRFDLDAFTEYERDHRTNKDFAKALNTNFKDQIEIEKKKLNGRNACFCFKSLKNSFEEGKNQVHTRSLHAEENAFLQIAKYGGAGISGGKLFSTASPCELCSKKARQLGIKEIYYIDPYPSISNTHILGIKPRLFNGAIGNAYHWLYDPIMPYKDELTLILGNPVKDLASRLKSEAAEKEKEIANRDKEIAELKAELTELKKVNKE